MASSVVPKNEEDFLKMKTVVKILALVLVLAAAVSMFVACSSRLSGSYEATTSDGEVSLLVFKGEEFTYTKGTTQLKGTYEIKKSGDSSLIFLIYDQTVVNGKTTKLDTPRYIGSEDGLSLYYGDDYVTIDNTKYTKK